ncbi:MAG TPA: molybdopterin-binding/glycosyltransferase family 2 protein [Polyangiaceae bacterium]|nr:molybdopterin-binding/glycosyltransferase family 2 protein [Polyangiaceae bacterium]
MRFGEVPVDSAEGAILAHSHRLGPAHTLKKGHILTAADCRELAAAGVQRLLAARLDSDDVDENHAARLVAQAAAGPAVTVGRAATGRANLFASARGLLIVSPVDVDECNAIDEGITLATLPPFAVVDRGALIATVKIIPFAVRAPVALEVSARARKHGPLVRVAAFVPKRAGLVLTSLPGVGDTQLARAAQNQRVRMTQLGGELARELRVDHSVESVARGVQALIDESMDLVLILGASAIVDRKDVVPAAIEAIGGVVEHLGMPVDPGNLLLLGRKGVVPIVGVPGCARSLKPSGFDWVLQRLAAEVPVGRADIVRLGAGGLLEGTSTSSNGGSATEPMEAPRIAAIVLAAGTSRRMEGTNKLLATVDGIPIVVRVVDAVLGAGVDPVLVVVGHESDRVRAALAGRAVRFVENPAYPEGLGASLRAGVEALEDDIDATLVVLGDMPWLRTDHVRKVIDAYDPRGLYSICVPVHDQKRGHPVLWSSRHFPEMRELGGDVGARGLLERHAQTVLSVPTDDAAILVDVDTPEMLDRVRAPR